MLGACSATIPSPVIEPFSDTGQSLIAAPAPSTTTSTQNIYIVQSNDTLYSIAKKNNLTMQKLITINHLAPPYLIYPGQKLYLLTPPQIASIVPPIHWQWPLHGKVSPIVSKKKIIRGVRIAAHPGSSVCATHSGQVVYAGNNLNYYGNLLIIQHAYSYSSVYGYNRQLLVQHGEQVHTGQVIARSGQAHDQKYKGLFFEIRHDGKPLNPLKLLPH